MSDATNVPQHLRGLRTDADESPYRAEQLSDRGGDDAAQLSGCVRLNGVRRALMSTWPEEVTIGDIASRWGFFRLSHFSEDYRALFCELPSQIIRRYRARGEAAIS